MAQELYELAKNPRRSIGRKLEAAQSEITSKVVEKAGRGFWGAAGTGFGKGALIAAGLIVAAFAVGFGLQAEAGMLSVVDYGSAGSFGLQQISSFAEGAMYGAFAGIGSPVTIAGALLGGTVGAIADVRAQQNQIEGEIAQQRSRSRQVERGMELLRQRTATTEKEAPAPSAPAEAPQEARTFFAERHPTRCAQTPEVSYCARELERRSQPSQTELKP